MIKVKVLRIQGGAIARNGVTISNLTEKAEAELGGFLARIAPENLIRVEQTVDAGSATGGWAVYTVVYNDAKAGRNDDEDAPRAVSKASRKEK